MRLTYQQIAHEMADLQTGGRFQIRAKSVAPVKPHHQGFLGPSHSALSFPSQPAKKAPTARPVWFNLLSGLHQDAASLVLWVIHPFHGTPEQNEAQAARVKRHINQRWDRVTLWSGRASRQTQVGLGQRLLDRWFADGWLEAPIRLHLAGPNEAGDVALVQRSFSAAEPHRAFVNLQAAGHLPMGRAGQALEGESTPVFHQWQVLAHEAAHTFFGTLTEPFQPRTCRPLIAQAAGQILDSIQNSPSSGKEGVNAVVAGLNQHLLGPGAFNVFHQLLDETFADVYGAMMFLRTTHFHGQAVDEVKLNISMRASDHQFFCRSTIAKDGWEWRCPQDVDIYDTANALQSMLAARAEWEALSPAAARGWALSLASDAFLALCVEKVAGGPLMTKGIETEDDMWDHESENSARITTAFVQGSQVEVWAGMADSFTHSPWFHPWAIMVAETQCDEPPAWVHKLRALQAQLKTVPTSRWADWKRHDETEDALLDIVNDRLSEFSESPSMNQALDVARAVFHQWLGAVQNLLVPALKSGLAPECGLIPPPPPVRRKRSLLG